MESFITAAKNSLPLLIVYIFAAVPAGIIESSGISKNLAERILPRSVSPNAGLWFLIGIFAFSTLTSFFISSTAMTTNLVAVSAPALLSISESTLIYAAIFAWMGGIIG